MNLRLVEGYDRQICDFVAARSPIGTVEFSDKDRGFAIIGEGDRLLAGVVFSNWVPQFSSVEISGVALSSFALSPGIVLALGEYAYRKLHANRVWARTFHKNARAIRLLEHIGFTAEGVHADHYGPGRHAGTYRMLRREWDAKYGMKEAA